MITVKLFAILRERAGASEIRITGPARNVADVLAAIGRESPSLAELVAREGIVASVNQAFAERDTAVADGDEVALMPPFSGGDTPLPRVRIQQAPFSIEREIAELKTASTAIGAVVSFLGTTRDLSGERRVSQLEFEHYPGMAEKKLQEIRDRALQDYGVIDVVIVHRVGIVPVGEDIVLIAVAAGHRDEAFRACRFCIDELKRITPIWKKETTPEGEVWVGEHP